MPELLTLKSKVELGCDRCDTCCKYRGDIRLTIKNIFDISRYLGITPGDFMDDYTHELEGQEPERALNAVGEFQECVMYDNKKKICTINSVKPLQCVIFPLVPESIKQDYFYVKGECKCQNKNLITVNEWLNGNNNIYKKNKEINYAWVKVIEEIQYFWNDFSDKQKLRIRKLLYKDYDFTKVNIDKAIKQNIKKIYEIVNEIETPSKVEKNKKIRKSIFGLNKHVGKREA